MHLQLYSQKNQKEIHQNVTDFLLAIAISFSTLLNIFPTYAMGRTTFIIILKLCSFVKVIKVYFNSLIIWFLRSFFPFLESRIPHSFFLSLYFSILFQNQKLQHLSALILQRRVAGWTSTGFGSERHKFTVPTHPHIPSLPSSSGKRGHLLIRGRVGNKIKYSSFSFAIHQPSALDN